MFPRTASTVFASVLLVAQLISAPFNHAQAMPMGDDGDCGSAAHHPLSTAQHQAGDDCGHMSANADGHCSHSGQHRHSHASCSCPCGHTPALTSVRSLILDPTPPIEAVGTLAAATFESPLFKVLRPPK